MEMFEELVMYRLTKDGDVFVSPQYDLGNGWSCPDFVALNFQERTASVVEVTAAYRPGNLAKKVAGREKQRFAKLRAQFEQNSIVDASWTYRVEVFVRREAASHFKQEFGTQTDVGIHVLEDIGFPWQWARSHK